MGSVLRMSTHGFLNAVRRKKLEKGQTYLVFNDNSVITEAQPQHDVGRIQQQRSYHLISLTIWVNGVSPSCGRNVKKHVPNRFMSQEPSQINKEELYENWKSGIDTDYLTPQMWMVHNAHMKALEAKQESYRDPVIDLEVLTIMTHLHRGYCCGNVCRHCPYQHSAIPPHFKGLMKFNTCFYH